MVKFAKILIINLLIICIIILSIEIMVRIIFPEINPLGISEKLFQKNKYADSFGFVPDNVIETAFGKPMITDSDGFLVDPTIIKSTNDDKLPKILIVGDSIAVGLGLTAKDSFSFILQRKLINYKIINTAVIGYGIEDYYNVLYTLIKKGYNFEGGIICLCINDVSFFSKLNINKSLEKKNEDYKYILMQNSIVRFLTKISDKYFDYNAILREYSRTYLLLKGILLDSGKSYFLADLEPYKNPEAGNYIKEWFKKINDILINNGKWAMFILCPYEYQLRQGSQIHGNIEILKPQRMFTENAQKLNTNFIDLYPIFVQKINEERVNSKDMYLFNDPMHFSKTGHQIIAQTIYKELLNHNLIK